MHSPKSTRRQRLVRASMTLCVAILPASCVTTTGSGETKALGHAAFCVVARPITWSGRDTLETVAQIKAHNAAGREICGWGR